MIGNGISNILSAFVTLPKEAQQTPTFGSGSAGQVRRKEGQPTMSVPELCHAPLEDMEVGWRPRYSP